MNMKNIPWLKVALIVPLLWFSSTAHGQDSSIQGLLDPQNVELGQAIKINDSYTQKWGGDVTAPFQLQIPVSSGVSPLYHPPEAGFDTLIRISFVTADQQLVENIRFTPMILSMGPIEKQMQTIADLLRDQVFPTFTDGYADVRLVGTRSTKINIYDAVELVGSYTDPEFGLMYLRIVGIINPQSDHTVFAIANVVDAQVKLTNPDQYAQTRGGIVLSNFQFLIE